MTPFRWWLLFLIFLSWLSLALTVSLRVEGIWLACPDWPTCFGRPLPTFSLLPTNLLIASRDLELFLAGATLTTALASLKNPRRWRAFSWGGSWFLLTAVQISFWIFKTEASATAQVAHLLVAMLALLAGTCLFLWSRPASWKAVEEHTALRLFGRTATALLLLQIWLGGWVAVQEAGSVCLDFPTCGGQWLPPFRGEALLFWQKMAQGSSPPPLGERITLQWLHRAVALLLFLMLLSLAWVAAGCRHLPAASRMGRWLSILTFLQIASGILLLRLELPLPLRIFHALGAGFLLQAVGGLLFYLRWRAEMAEGRSVQPESEMAAPETPSEGLLLARLSAGLEKTRSRLSTLLTALPGHPTVDEQLLEEIETQLLLADVGVETTQWILSELQNRFRKSPPRSREEVVDTLREVLLQILEPCSQPLTLSGAEKPFVILVVGVNGVGKTTTIGKLAWFFKHQGKRVMLAAADTFRAAAIDQLKRWGERVGVPVIAQQPGADAAAVAYDALEAAKARGYDILIIDTAGRLHTKAHLMEELSKVARVLKRVDPKAPHEVLLVLDATIGQNALVQAEEFMKAVPVSGIVLTKLDGTAKGGVIFALARRFRLPIRLIGVGEGVEDLQPFDARLFVEALLPRQPELVH